jgi:hypothetical protein
MHKGKQLQHRTTFQQFLKAHPTLADDLSRWDIDQDDRHADINCWMKDGTKVDYQLAEWLHAEQMSDSLSRARTQQAILEELRCRYPGPPPSLKYGVCLLLRSDLRRLDRQDISQLADEFGELVGEATTARAGRREWHQGYPYRAFDNYPAVGKYLLEAHFDWLKTSGQPIFSEQWIVFEPDGGAYDPSEAYRTAVDTVLKKGSHYGVSGTPFDLILHFSRAYLHNAPFHSLETPTFEDLAKKMSEDRRTTNLRTFGSIYLLNELEPNPEVFRINPQFERCTR